MSLGYLGATFDLLNVRDLDVIQQAATRCRHLVIGVFRDELVERHLGRQPVVPLDERVRLVSHVRGVARAEVHHGWSDDHATLFAFREDADLVPSDRVVLLDPSRESVSQMLRRALAPADTRAVA